MSDVLILRGDARALPIADECVQCVVTSPPYWGLRKYAGDQELIWPTPQSQGVVRCLNGEHLWTQERGFHNSTKGNNGSTTASNPNHHAAGRFDSEHGFCSLCGAWRGAFGLEPTIEMYVAHTVEILREIRRVLRPDGVVFWNIADSYHSARGYGGDLKPSDLQSSNRGSLRGKDTYYPNRFPQSDLKPKDLCLIPARVALAAQGDGWWVRSMIIWAKPNPMPESVTDRPTDAYEHILMLTKSERYFWDADAVRRPLAESTLRDARTGKVTGTGRKRYDDDNGSCPSGIAGALFSGGNMRNVWAFATQPYPGAHFATFPEEIPRRCILAATSAKGACVNCGAPWQRITKRKAMEIRRTVRGEQSGNRTATSGTMVAPLEIETIGWKQTCGQGLETRPCIVLDPFAGSGTVARVAVELNRHAISVDLAYHDQAAERTRFVQRQLVQL